MKNTTHKANNGNSPKPRLRLDKLKNFRIFAVVYGSANHPEAAAILSFHFFHKDARQKVHQLHRSGFLAEVVSFAIPGFYFI